MWLWARVLQLGFPSILSSPSKPLSPQSLSPQPLPSQAVPCPRQLRVVNVFKCFRQMPSGKLLQSGGGGGVEDG